MIGLALAGRRFAQQVATAPGALAGIEVKWCGDSLEALRREAPRLRPDALAIDSADLGDFSTALLKELLDGCGARLAVVTYSFAARATVRALASERVRLVQGPLTLDALRAHLSFLVVQDLLVKKEPHMASTEAPRRRFTPEQLGKLLEISSQLQCECPNHLAQLVTRLQDFEDYSASCANRDDADVAMHQKLYLATGEARKGMEDALAALLEFEHITV